jgi:hypothetical protein
MEHHVHAHVREVSRVAAQLIQCVTTHPNDLLTLLLLANELATRNQTTYQVASTCKQSFRALPSAILMMIAMANTDPSLRTMGLTCKAWRHTTNQYKQILAWTRKLYRMSDVALMEFQWLANPVALPSRVLRLANRCITFTSTEAITSGERSKWETHPLVRHVCVCWDKGEEADSEVLSMRIGIVSAHLTRSTLLFLADPIEYGGTLKCTLSRYNRDATGNVNKWAGKHQTFTVVAKLDDCDFYSIQIRACAWSPRSLFVCSRGAYDQELIVEYDLNTCVAKRRVPVELLFSTSLPMSYRVYMTWVSDLLLVAVGCNMGPTTGGQRMVLAALHWESGTYTLLPEKRCREDTLIATLQVHNGPLFYLSFQNRSPSTMSTRLHVWGPECTR